MPQRAAAASCDLAGRSLWNSERRQHFYPFSHRGSYAIFCRSLIESIWVLKSIQRVSCKCVIVPDYFPETDETRRVGIRTDTLVVLQPVAIGTLAGVRASCVNALRHLQGATYRLVPDAFVKVCSEKHCPVTVALTVGSVLNLANFIECSFSTTNENGAI